MSRTAPKKNESAHHAPSISSPSLNGAWSLQVKDENQPAPGLQMLNYIEITEPAPDGPPGSISGYIMAAFPIANGTYVGDTVSFSACILGVNYGFSGTVSVMMTPAGEERKIDGYISSSNAASSSNGVPRLPNTEDASWSAQAQGGGGTDDEEGRGRQFGRAHPGSR